MPYKRYARKPRRALRRRNAPKRMYRPTVRRLALKNIFKYKRFCADSTIQNVESGGNVKWVDAANNWALGSPVLDDNGLYQFGGSMKFQLQDVISSGDFTNLYDRYKITGAKITFIPLQNQGYNALSTTGNQQSGTIPTLHYTIDYDDTTVPITSLDVLDRMDAKVRMLNKPVSIYIKYPKLTSIIQSDSGNVAAGIAAKGWINCSNIDVNFRGLKFYLRDVMLPDATKNQNALIRVVTKYYLSFKDPQ